MDCCRYLCCMNEIFEKEDKTATPSRINILRYLNSIFGYWNRLSFRNNIFFTLTHFPSVPFFFFFYRVGEYRRNTGMMEQDYVTREFYFHTLAYISFTIKSRTFVSRGGCCMRTCSILSSFLIHPRGYPLEITSHLPPLLILEIRVIFQYRLRTTSHHEIPIRCNSSNRAMHERCFHARV